MVERLGSRRARERADVGDVAEQLDPWTTPVTISAARHSRRSVASAANGISHATYQGSSELAVTSSAAVAQRGGVDPVHLPRHTRRTSQHEHDRRTRAASAQPGICAEPSACPAVPMKPGMLCQSPSLWLSRIVPTSRCSGPRAEQRERESRDRRRARRRRRAAGRVAGPANWALPSAIANGEQQPAGQLDRGAERPSARPPTRPR